MHAFYAVVFNTVLCVCAAVKGAPNFVFVLTDDHDIVLNGLDPMPKTLRSVANNGVTFENAFVHSPICCPSRSSILTGRYLHNIHVYNNSVSGNCSSPDWQRNHEGKTIAAILKGEGNYTTFYAGKYLNQYGSREANGVTHIPKGYDWWLGLKGNSKYYDYTLSINGTGKHFTNEYLTDVMSDYALEFLNGRQMQPFFMMLAPPAAHAPFTPAPRHANAFPSLKAVRTPAFNHTPEKKHWLLQLPPVHLQHDVTILNNIHRKRHQTLMSVDEMVESIVKKLRALKILDNTYIIFTSDNGFHIGQFGMPWDKRQPYDTDVRVPLLIRGPNIKKKKQTTPYAVTLVDLAPTILELAGIEAVPVMDGLSFKQVLENPDVGFYERLILTEYYGEGNAKSVDDRCNYADASELSECSTDNWCKCQDSRNNSYACIRHIGPNVDYKDCLFMDDQSFEECYDLLVDPYELQNTCKIPGDVYKKKLLEALNCVGVSCSLILK